ncbi:MAG: methylglyoxal synthase [Marinagarivorans sp.]|nr:methylglyoxal synthase [Marinagarivorans sp.]
MNVIKVDLPAQKNIALVAHDNKKPALIEWVKKHKALLAQHHLCGTGTTGKKIADALGLPVHRYLSGPLGGDQQIGSHIAEGKIHCLIFFWDPFEPMPHDPDVKALLRLAAAWNIPVANNSASADLLVSSPLFNQIMNRDIPDYGQYLATRTD